MNLKLNYQLSRHWMTNLLIHNYPLTASFVAAYLSNETALQDQKTAIWADFDLDKLADFREIALGCATRQLRRTAGRRTFGYPILFRFVDVPLDDLMNQAQKWFDNLFDPVAPANWIGKFIIDLFHVK